MAAWVDFKAIKSEVGMEKILERYGVLGTLKRKGTNLVGPCPIHKGTNPSQFHVSLAKNNFNCFGDCHDGGNVIDFVILMEGMKKGKLEDVRKAALLLHEWFGITSERARKQPAESVMETAAAEKTPPPERVEEPEKVNPPLKFALRSLDPEHPYLSERELTQETITTFGLGYFKGKGLMAGRIAIPIHNEQGELVAYVGRWPGDEGWPEGEGKYKLPAGFKKSLVVFNLHRACELAKEKGLIVVEGFFDTMKIWQAGFQNVVSPMGSSLSEEQEKLIVEAVGSQGRVTLMFDQDEAGRIGRDGRVKDGVWEPGALQRLAPQVHVKVIDLTPEGMQPDKLTAEEIRAYLT